MKMSCDKCSVTFNFFKRKKYCQECHRYFCSTCLPKPQSSSSVGRQCSKCRLLMSGLFSRDDLQSWKVSDMRCFLNVRNISVRDCREKHDLIELVLAHFCRHPRQSAQDQAEHEFMVQQMTAHVRNVSFINEPSGAQTTTSKGNQTSDTTAEAAPPPKTQNQPLSASSSSTSSSTTSSTTATENVTSAKEPSSSFTTSLTTGMTSESSSTCPSLSTESSTRAANQNESEEDLGLGFGGHTYINMRDLLESVIRGFDQQEEEGEQNVQPERPIRRAQLDDITDVAGISGLTVRQLKELLVNNFVDYKGCCEKGELIEKVKHLWKDYQVNKIRAQRIHKEEETEYSLSQQTKGAQDQVVTPAEDNKDEPELLTHVTASSVDAKGKEETQVSTDENIHHEETAVLDAARVKPAPPATTTADVPSPSRAPHSSDSLCNICMDSLVDCLLLECGHMVTCTQCGKRLAECPICRQYIVRVVRVFRS